MKLISLDEAVKIWRYPIEISHMTKREWYNALADMEALPTIDTVEIIDKKIEFYKTGFSPSKGGEIQALELLKHSLLLHPSSHV